MTAAPATQRRRSASHRGRHGRSTHRWRGLHQRSRPPVPTRNHRHARPTADQQANRKRRRRQTTGLRPPATPLPDRGDNPPPDGTGRPTSPTDGTRGSGAPGPLTPGPTPARPMTTGDHREQPCDLHRGSAHTRGPVTPPPRPGRVWRLGPGASPRSAGRRSHIASSWHTGSGPAASGPPAQIARPGEEPRPQTIHTGRRPPPMRRRLPGGNTAEPAGGRPSTPSRSDSPRAPQEPPAPLGRESPPTSHHIGQHGTHPAPAPPSAASQPRLPVPSTQRRSASNGSNSWV